jgi:adenosylcobyric acid synthase
LTARALMLQGTGSDVGKSLLLAGLARAYTRRGLVVRPFKPQNMSNNAAVTADGGEIGRAQALQARACGVAPLADMNPILLKPQSEGGAQIVLGGRVWGSASARGYRRLAPSLLPMVLAAFARVAAAADLVLVEGAGSPAEINLRRGDVANMGFAEAAGVPVVLIGDIERGGVIAQLVGTYALLTPTERALLAGYIVNKFRGDRRLFDGGIAAIGARTQMPSFGVVPFFPAASRLPAEDSLALSRAIIDPPPYRRGDGRLRIAVPVVPHIANFDDLDPLATEPQVDLVMVRPGRPLPRDAALIILPGSKAVIADLAFLRRQGWDIDILAHHRQGGRILGLCGGYQMLGRTIADPLGVEGPRGTAAGLDLLDLDTVLARDKRLLLTRGLDLETEAPVEGYEMHQGATSGPGLSRPMLRLGDRNDGAVAADGRIAGCYLHGLFASDPFRSAFLRRLGGAPGAFGYLEQIEATLDALADHLAANLDLDRLLAAARPAASEPRHDMQEEPNAKDKGAFDQASKPIKSQRAGDILGRGAGGAIADPGIGNDEFGIATRAGQCEPKRPGHRSLRPAGIDRAMLARIPQHDRDRMAGTATPGKDRGGGDEEPTEPRRDQVQEIVEPRRGPAEGQVMPVLVADHAVEGARHLVPEQAGEPSDEVPEHRRDDAVAKVLGQALDRRADDAVCIEARRIATDDMANRGASGPQSAAVEFPRDGGDVLVEAALSDEDGNQQNLDGGTGNRATAQPLDGEPEQRRTAGQNDDGDDAAAAARGFAADLAIEPAIEKGDGAAGERHRVRHQTEHRRHVAQRAVDGEAGDEQQQRVGDRRRHGETSLGRGRPRVNR